MEPNPDNFKSLLSKNRKSYSIETCLSTKSHVIEVSFDAAGKKNTARAVIKAADVPLYLGE